MKHYYVKYDDDIAYAMNKNPFVKSIEKIALEELIANPEKWKKRVYDVMGYLPHDYLFRLLI